MNTDRAYTLVVEVDNDPHALSRILDRITLLQIACASVSARRDASCQRAVIELTACTPERAATLKDKLNAMPCVLAACVLPQAGIATIGP